MIRKIPQSDTKDSESVPVKVSLIFFNVDIFAYIISFIYLCNVKNGILDIRYCGRPDLRGVLSSVLDRESCDEDDYAGSLDAWWKEHGTLDGYGSSVGVLEGGNNNTVYYYPDFREKSSREKFDSLVSFDRFCDEQGFCISDNDAEDLAYNRISHVCINPFARSMGRLDLLCSSSYADLYYNALCLEGMDDVEM